MKAHIKTYKAAPKFQVMEAHFFLGNFSEAERLLH
jgi:hypothetical protein